MTDSEKHSAVNAKITQWYPKMVLDSKRIAGTNYDFYGEDLLAHCLEDFITNKPLDYKYKVAVEDNKLPNFIGHSMALAIKSSTSPFWIKYRKAMYNNRGLYLTETEDSDELIPDYDGITEADDEFDTPYYFKSIEDCLHHNLDKIHWYHARLIREYYYEGLTYQALHEKYNITLNSLRRDINKGLKELKKLCSKM